MAGKENIAGCPEVNVEAIDLPWHQILRLGLGVAVSGANDSFGEIPSKSAGVYIDQFGGEVRIHGGGRRIKLDLYRTGHLGIGGEWLSGVDQNVLQLLHRSLVMSAGRLVCIAAERTAGGRHWILGIVLIVVLRLSPRSAGGEGRRRH